MIAYLSSSTTDCIFCLISPGAGNRIPILVEVNTELKSALGTALQDVYDLIHIMHDMEYFIRCPSTKRFNEKRDDSPEN